MIFTVYILFSKKYNKIYIGYTSNLLERIKSHNSLGKNNWTKKYRPWIVIYCEYFECKLQAIQREKLLKSGKGREWIRSVINDQFFISGFISA